MADLVGLSGSNLNATCSAFVPALTTLSTLIVSTILIQVNRPTP